MKENIIYKAQKFETYNSGGDIYCLFYEFGTKIMAPHSTSIGAFITSNKWLRAKYGKKLRNFLLAKANPTMIIDLGPNVFDAGVDTNILLWDNSTYSNSTSWAKAYDINLDKVKFLNQSLMKNSIWTIVSDAETEIKKKIDLIPTHLSDFNVRLNYGILTGANPVFILNKNKAQKLISIDRNNKKLIKPILRGKDLYRYEAIFNDWYLLNLHNGVKSKNVPPISLDEYPTIISYLESFGAKFHNRGEQGENWWNLRSCNYILDYEKPKILYSDIVQDRGKFYYDEKGYYTNDTAFMIIGENLKYLTAILNSTLFSFLYKKFYSGGGLGKKGLRYKKEFLLMAPIPKATNNLRNRIEDIVDTILNLKNKTPLIDTSVYEKEIDMLVYQLYGLDSEDIKVIEVNHA